MKIFSFQESHKKAKKEAKEAKKLAKKLTKGLDALKKETARLEKIQQLLQSVDNHKKPDGHKKAANDEDEQTDSTMDSHNSTEEE